MVLRVSRTRAGATAAAQRCGERGHAGQVAEEVQGGALGRQQPTGRRLHHRARRLLGAVRDPSVAMLEQAPAAQRPMTRSKVDERHRNPGEHAVLYGRPTDGRHPLVGGNGCGGRDVRSVRQVLVERSASPGDDHVVHVETGALDQHGVGRAELVDSRSPLLLELPSTGSYVVVAVCTVPSLHDALAPLIARLGEVEPAMAASALLTQLRRPDDRARRRRAGWLPRPRRARQRRRRAGLRCRCVGGRPRPSAVAQRADPSAHGPGRIGRGRSRSTTGERLLAEHRLPALREAHRPAARRPLRPATRPSVTPLEASRLAPWTPVAATSPTAKSPGTDVVAVEAWPGHRRRRSARRARPGSARSPGRCRPPGTAPRWSGTARPSPDRSTWRPGRRGRRCRRAPLASRMAIAVATTSRGARSPRGWTPAHHRASGAVDQGGTLATHGLGDQQLLPAGLRLPEGSRVELHELDVGHRRAGPPRECEPVTGRLRRDWW